MSVLAIVFIAIGFILLFIEIFLIPGLGPVGVMGGVLMVAGVLIAGYKEGTGTAVYTGITVALALPLCVVGFWLMPKTKFGKSFILDASEHSESGFKSGTEDLDRFIGRAGVTLTSLRPAGIVDIDGVRLDVVTRGDFIEEGEEVKVIKIEGSRVVVGT